MKLGKQGERCATVRVPGVDNPRRVLHQADPHAGIRVHVMRFFRWRVVWRCSLERSSQGSSTVSRAVIFIAYSGPYEPWSSYWTSQLPAMRQGDTSLLVVWRAVQMPLAPVRPDFMVMFRLRASTPSASEALEPCALTRHWEFSMD